MAVENPAARFRVENSASGGGGGGLASISEHLLATRSGPVSPVFGRRRRRLVERSALGLELDELARHVVTASLRQDPQHGPASLVEVDTASQRTPQRTAGPLNHVAHLKHRQADDSVLARETVVSHAQVKFVEVRVRVASERTVSQHHIRRHLN